MPFRQAHEIVGGIVRDLLASGREFGQLRLDEWRAYSSHFESDVIDAVTPEASVAARKTPQSTNPEAVNVAPITT